MESIGEHESCVSKQLSYTSCMKIGNWLLLGIGFCQILYAQDWRKSGDFKLEQFFNDGGSL